MPIVLSYETVLNTRWPAEGNETRRISQECFFFFWSSLCSPLFELHSGQSLSLTSALPLVTAVFPCVCAPTRLQEVNSMINKRLKDVLFTDQWSEACMDRLSPFGYVLVSKRSSDTHAGTRMHTHAHMQARTHTHIQDYKNTHAHTPSHTHIHGHSHTGTHTHVQRKRTHILIHYHNARPQGLCPCDGEECCRSGQQLLQSPLIGLLQPRCYINERCSPSPAAGRSLKQSSGLRAPGSICMSLYLNYLSLFSLPLSLSLIYSNSLLCHNDLLSLALILSLCVSVSLALYVHEYMEREFTYKLDRETYRLLFPLRLV